MLTGGQKDVKFPEWNKAALQARVVRYRDLIPCRNAFIDARTPGSDTKENFTIIGPGVAENPEQHIHINEAHGFNIGGARQPPRCVNSQHSHDTAEVFVVHTGDWLFTFGEHGEDAQVEAGPGDIVSFPTQSFRGFENVGEETGFLWSVLGGDDPGRVLWAPQVFELAEQYGLVLLENGALIDTTVGQTVPDGLEPMPVTSPEMMATLRRMQPNDVSETIARAPRNSELGEKLIIGPGGELPPTQDFTLSRLVLDTGEANPVSHSHRPEVVFVQRGAVNVWLKDTMLALGKGDTLTVPRGLERSYWATGSGAELIVVRGID